MKTIERYWYWLNTIERSISIFHYCIVLNFIEPRRRCLAITIHGLDESHPIFKKPVFFICSNLWPAIFNFLSTFYFGNMCFSIDGHWPDLIMVDEKTTSNEKLNVDWSVAGQQEFLIFFTESTKLPKIFFQQFLPSNLIFNFDCLVICFSMALQLTT